MNGALRFALLTMASGSSRLSVLNYQLSEFITLTK